MSPAKIARPTLPGAAWRLGLIVTLVLLLLAFVSVA